MKKSLVYLLLLHLSFGILAPALVLLDSDTSEETIALITNEKELDMEKEEFEKTVFFYPQLFDKKAQTPSTNLFHLRASPYQDIVVGKLIEPPRVQV